MMYAGCTFADFSGNEVMALGESDTSVSLMNCTLAGNTVWQDNWYDGGHALISAVSAEYRDDYKPWKILATTVLVRMERCLLLGNSITHSLWWLRVLLLCSWCSSFAAGAVLPQDR